MIDTISLRYLGLIILFSCWNTFAQSPLHSGVLVSDLGTNNNIGRANTSRNIAISKDGTIYVVYTGLEGIRVAKSTDRGAQFSSSVLVTPTNSEPEIIVNDYGDIFVAWSFLENIFISKSNNKGASFSEPQLIAGSRGNAVHMAVYQDIIYLIDERGGNIYKMELEAMGYLFTQLDPVLYMPI